jgi:hypothetical protein
MQAEYSISIHVGISLNGLECFFVKLQGLGCELNIAVSECELEKLRAIAGSRWSDRTSLQVGRCLGTPVFWSCEDGCLSVLVGVDDEIWEVGFTAPESLVTVLLKEIDRVQVK